MFLGFPFILINLVLQVSSSAVLTEVSSDRRPTLVYIEQTVFFESNEHNVTKRSLKENFKIAEYNHNGKGLKLYNKTRDDTREQIWSDFNSGKAFSDNFVSKVRGEKMRRFL